MSTPAFINILANLYGCAFNATNFGNLDGSPDNPATIAKFFLARTFRLVYNYTDINGTISGDVTLAFNSGTNLSANLDPWQRCLMNLPPNCADNNNLLSYPGGTYSGGISVNDITDYWPFISEQGVTASPPSLTYAFFGMGLAMTDDKNIKLLPWFVINRAGEPVVPVLIASRYKPNFENYIQVGTASILGITIPVWSETGPFSWSLLVDDTVTNAYWQPSDFV